MSYKDFFFGISQAKLEIKNPVKVVAHFDADGICSASILIYFLKAKGVDFSIDFVPVLTDDFIESLKDEGTHFFVDVGSAALEKISSSLPDSEKVVLDHHEVVGKADFVHINPEIFGLDSANEVSGAGVVYLFLKDRFPGIKKMSHLAVVGAIGDYLINGSISKLNNDIINEAITEGLLLQSRDIRILQNKSLVKYISQYKEPYIPGVSGDRAKAEEFLGKVDIPISKDGKDTVLADLDSDQKQRLAEGMIAQRKDEDDPTDIYGTNFKLINEGDFNCAFDFATLLNACGRMGEGLLGCDVALGKPGALKKAREVLQAYRKKIHEAIDWYTKNKQHFIHGKNFIIIDAGRRIMPSIIGTLSSIITRSFNLSAGTIVVIVGDWERNIKVSIRTVAPSTIDIPEILSETKVGGIYGGHKGAAGAVMPIENKEIFIKQLKARLERDD